MTGWTIHVFVSREDMVAALNYDLKKHTEWEPAVYFRNNIYAWMEAVISYPVEPSDTTGRRTRILKSVLPVLNNSPEKVQFPEGAKR